MRITVHCETCDLLCADALVDDVRLGAALLQCVHATPPHSHNHRLVMRVDGDPPPKGTRILRIECQSCGEPDKTRLYQTTTELVPAMVMAFHAGHEGHPLALFLDGNQIHPPT